MKFLGFLIVCAFSVAVIAKPAPTVLSPASQCQTLKCVRQNIDSIDTQLVTLLGERFANVQRAGQLKKQTATAVHDSAREANILAAVQTQAEQQAYPAAPIVNVFKAILAQANNYEKKQ